MSHDSYVGSASCHVDVGGAAGHETRAKGGEKPRTQIEDYFCVLFANSTLFSCTFSFILHDYTDLTWRAN